MPNLQILSPLHKEKIIKPMIFCYRNILIERHFKMHIIGELEPLANYVLN